MNKLLVSKRGLWLPKKHHSTGDWDFEETFWELEVADYQSAPSSLEITRVVTSQVPWTVLCKAADTTVIDQGRIVTWLKGQTMNLAFPLLFFRAQAAVGSPGPNDSYYVKFSNGMADWYYRDSGGSDTLIQGYAGGLSNDTWYKFRITWWNGKDLQNQDATVLRIERFVSSAWTQIDSDAYDTNERNKGSAINRVGVGIGGAYIWWVRFDDTEIWCPGS